MPTRAEPSNNKGPKVHLGANNTAPLNPGMWWAISVAVLGLAVSAMYFFEHHSPGQSKLLPPCMFNHLTGYFCTGCGITRAFWALSHGMVGQALSMNALAVLAIPLAALAWINEGLGRRGSLEKVCVWIRDARVWAVLVLGFTLTRNIPVSPMSWLAPL